MTHEEQANEYVSMFISHTRIPHMGDWVDDIIEATKCAIILVDKLIEQIEHLNNNTIITPRYEVQHYNLTTVKAILEGRVKSG